MRAAVLHGYGRPFTLEDVAEPVVPDGGALVEVGAVGVCRSDVAVRRGDRRIIPRFPWVLGHEIAGRVTTVGSHADGSLLGSEVAVFGGWGCGRCWRCSHGREHLCGLQHRLAVASWGGYARYVAVPKVEYLLPLPGLPVEVGAVLTDAGATSYRALRKGLDAVAGSPLVAVIGAGGLGQFAVRWSRQVGVDTSVAFDPSPLRLGEARQLGADVGFLAAGETEESMVRELAHGRPVVCLDFVGSDSTLALGCRLVREGGVVVVVGLAGGEIPIGYASLPNEGMITSSTWGSRDDLNAVLQLARESDQEIVVEASPLSDIEAVFASMEAGQYRTRTVLRP